MVAPDTSPEQMKNCINTVSDITLFLKEALIVWELIQTSAMSIKFNILLRNAQQHLRSCWTCFLHIALSSTRF